MDFIGLTAEQWRDLGLSFLLVVAAMVLGRWILDFLLKRLAGRLAQSTETELDDALLTAVRPPLYWLLLLIILKAAIMRLDFIPAAWGDPLGDLFHAADVIIAFIFIGRLAHHLMVWYGDEVAQRTDTKLDEQLLPFFRRLAMVFLVLIGLIVLLGRFVDVTSLVTTLGVGSLAIALAAQAALSDTISGFLIMVDQPYRIGDRIEIQDLDTWGGRGRHRPAQHPHSDSGQPDGDRAELGDGQELDRQSRLSEHAISHPDRDRGGVWDRPGVGAEHHHRRRADGGRGVAGPKGGGPLLAVWRFGTDLSGAVVARVLCRHAADVRSSEHGHL